MRKLSKDIALNFRDQLREARFKAQKDTEAFGEVLFSVERLGCYLREEQGTLGKYRPFIIELATWSPLFNGARHACREMHIPFPQLYDLVNEARNGAMHDGARVRYATSHAVELALVLEDSLMNTYDRAGDFKVSDFMVRNPVCAAMWQPLSFIRQTMLVNSFSCLPVNAGADPKPAWHLVSATAVAQYLKLSSNGVPLRDLVVQSLEEATKGDGLKLVQARTCRATDAVKTVMAGWDGQPVLVMHGETQDVLGILTPYDLL